MSLIFAFSCSVVHCRTSIYFLSKRKQQLNANTGIFRDIFRSFFLFCVLNFIICVWRSISFHLCGSFFLCSAYNTQLHIQQIFRCGPPTPWTGFLWKVSFLIRNWFFSGLLFHLNSDTLMHKPLKRLFILVPKLQVSFISSHSKFWLWSKIFRRAICGTNTKIENF